MTSCDGRKNPDLCNCTYEPCSKKGFCCECVAYHRRSGQLPACFFPDDVEKTFDRSFARFVKVFEERGRWW